jgi:uncharacterized protein (UPF0332 family)
MEKAEECLKSAQLTIELQSYLAAANRSYYAIFHAMRAVLALDGSDPRKHSGVISEFRRRYIKTGILDKALSPMIDEAFDIRTDCDYLDFFVISKEEVTEQVRNAEIFVKAIKEYLQRRT